MAGPFETQDSNPDAWVGVREGLHRDTGEVHTEFLIQGKNTGEHLHFGINLDGEQIYGPPV